MDYGRTLTLHLPRPTAYSISQSKPKPCCCRNLIFCKWSPRPPSLANYRIGGGADHKSWPIRAPTKSCSARTNIPKNWRKNRAWLWINWFLIALLWLTRLFTIHFPRTPISMLELSHRGRSVRKWFDKSFKLWISLWNDLLFISKDNSAFWRCPWLQKHWIVGKTPDTPYRAR